MVVLAYLGALGNEFICRQWERRGMHTDIYFYVKCKMGAEANVLHSPVSFSSWIFWNVGSYMSLIINSLWICSGVPRGVVLGGGGFQTPPPEIPKISVESSITWARRTGVWISFC